MTDAEFEVMDELYFVISFENLKQKLDLSEMELKDILGHLVAKNYVKCFKSVSDELPHEAVDFERSYRIYHYLASKEGLFAHNSR